MTAKLIDGKAVAAKIREGLRARVSVLTQRYGAAPGLAVILVGEDPASAVYVRNKIRVCEAVGIQSFSHRFSSDVRTEELVALVENLNADPSVHGILVQLPLPPHIDMARVLETISVEKDADAFHLYNVGGLVVGRNTFSPCTPFGVMKLLESERIPGGVGPMTVTMLLENTIGSMERTLGRAS